MAPFVPDGTTAEFATTPPNGAFNVETTGCVPPAPHVDK
jgi:hypothetical protein